MHATIDTWDQRLLDVAGRANSILFAQHAHAPTRLDLLDLVHNSHSQQEGDSFNSRRDNSDAALLAQCLTSEFFHDDSTATVLALARDKYTPLVNRLCGFTRFAEVIDGAPTESSGIPVPLRTIPRPFLTPRNH